MIRNSITGKNPSVIVFIFGHAKVSVNSQGIGTIRWIKIDFEGVNRIITARNDGNGIFFVLTAGKEGQKESWPFDTGATTSRGRHGTGLCLCDHVTRATIYI